MSEYRPRYHLGRQGKYNAHRTEVDGVVFDSKAEANRYLELKLLLQAGEITDLVLHPRFELAVKGQKICSYIADFQYKDQHGQTITEDVKGKRTAVYQLKKKLMRAIHGIEIAEIS